MWKVIICILATGLLGSLVSMGEVFGVPTKHFHPLVVAFVVLTCIFGVSRFVEWMDE